MRFLTAILMTFLLAGHATARPLDETEQTALMKAVDSYLRATGAGNAEKIVDTIPPRIVNVFAGSAGIEAKKVQETLVTQTKEILKTTKISEFVASKGPFDAQDSKLADGTDITWVVVPIEFTAEANGKKTRNAQPLLALHEGEKWYFSRIDGPQQQQIVALAYPFMTEAKLPQATSTPLN